MQKRKCTLWIKLLGHISCLAMESHAAKLPVHSFCADVNARGDVYLHSYQSADCGRILYYVQRSTTLQC